MLCAVQSIQKEHGLDNFEKVKKESVLEMVSICLSRMPTNVKSQCPCTIYSGFIMACQRLYGALCLLRQA